MKGAVPIAATEKVAVWPEVTVWLVGCVLIDGADGAGLLLPETIPEHPEFTIASSTANNPRAQRFIVRLFHEIFSGAAGRYELEHPAGEYTF